MENDALAKIAGMSARRSSADPMSLAGRARRILYVYCLSIHRLFGTYCGKSATQLLSPQQNDAKETQIKVIENTCGTLVAVKEVSPNRRSTSYSNI